jgi:hypothetical protein
MSGASSSEQSIVRWQPAEEQIIVQPVLSFTIPSRVSNDRSGWAPEGDWVMHTKGRPLHLLILKVLAEDGPCGFPTSAQMITDWHGRYEEGSNIGAWKSDGTVLMIFVRWKPCTVDKLCAGRFKWNSVRKLWESINLEPRVRLHKDSAMLEDLKNDLADAKADHDRRAQSSIPFVGWEIVEETTVQSLAL